jgi:predicted secreted protein
MDRIGTFLILLVAALVLIPGTFAEEAQTSENTTVTVEDVNATVNETAAVPVDFEANMSVSTLEKVGINQTVAISLTAEDEGKWNTTLTKGLEAVGEPVATNGTEVYTIKAITAGKQSFSAIHEALNETAKEAGETYKLEITVE